uniref:Reverse transcriptase domain-containing protein n=1 Tax=Tanacetum cinerariifolium TaxID=118510 RepID=A0A699IEZ8_TANCI|nr:reverse transcriptase domain-containing protein [Tanacetum cinerariifolium]
MEDFYRPSLIGRGGPIVSTTIPGTDFALKNHTIQLIRQNCQFHRFKDEDANEHLERYLSITQFIKQNEHLEVLEKQTAYTIQSVRHRPGPGHPNTVYYLDYDESDEDEPSEVLEVQRSIHHLSDNPNPSFDPIVESLSPFPTPFEDKKSSGSTTTHSNYSFSDYEAFYFDDDHIEEKSSGSTNTHSDFYLPEYDLFIFDLLIDPFPPADKSVSHYVEFADELTHIISSAEYDCFYLDIETDSGELTILLKKIYLKIQSRNLQVPSLMIFLSSYPIMTLLF